MQRYNATSCSSAVNNNAHGGPSVRDVPRADTASLSNFSLNSRRVQPVTYKLKCDKESLNSRLGPPDFHPQTSNCPEETLTKEYVQSGYKETVEGIEETREVSLNQVSTFTKPVVLKCKEAIRKHLRAITEARAQKRKAGQVYGVPLSGSLLAKPGIFPEQGPCDEDLLKKWIEGLSQPHKRLRTLADFVPHCYKKKSLFEVLIRNNVPLLRATWLIKVIYLNQFRAGSSTEKAQFSRTEQWTKDVIDYLQCLVDDVFSRNSSYHPVHGRDRPLQVLYTGSMHNRGELASTSTDGKELSSHFKWWYMVRMLQWHHSEGLLLPSGIIDWVLNQLQDKKVLEILQLVLPIIYGFIETLVLSQTYVRTLVGVAVGFIQEPPPGGLDLVDNSRRAYITSAIVELLRYLLMAVPDTFVALDCFPLPHCVISNIVTDGSFLSKASENASKNGPLIVSRKGPGAQYNSLSFSHVVSSIQKRAEVLAKAASPGYPGHNVAKAVRALDKALVLGDVRGAYRILFENLGDGNVDKSWMAEVSPCLRSSLKQISNVSSSLINTIFFLCEWAVCDFRDFRTAPPSDMKFSGRKDYSQIYIAIRLLKQKMQGFQDVLSSCNSKETVHGIDNYLNAGSGKSISFCSPFQSPGPLHDIIVCWIDQHEMHKGDGFKCLQLLMMELIRSGIFYPQVYVRQLIVSGIMDNNGPPLEQNKRKKHYQVLKQLPGCFVRGALEEQIAETPLLLEVMRVYANERRLMLREYKCTSSVNITSCKRKCQQTCGRDAASPTPKTSKSGGDILELKSAISALLQLPNSPLANNTCLDEFQGTVKRSTGPSPNTVDILAGTPGCEECRKVKKQKVCEDKIPCFQRYSSIFLDDEDTWWVRKGKPIEPLKADQPLRPTTKQVTRGRQKTVQKTQSLAQLTAARIESSQGASTSHVCDNKISCPHHRTTMEGEAYKSNNGIRTAGWGDLVLIGKALKRLPFVERMGISRWLISLVKQCVEESEKNLAKAGQFKQTLPPGEWNPVRWKLGEDELAMILYLMDVSNDLVFAVRFLLWLLPRIVGSPSSTIHGGRNMLMAKAVESHVCEVSECFLLSSVRRYENVMAAADLIPEALSATMQRAAAIMVSNARGSSSPALFYAKQLLKKYGSIPNVIEWEKKANCDKKFLAEPESGRSLEVDMGFPLAVPSGEENLDDYFRQKVSVNRFSRVAVSMKDVVQRNVEDAFQHKDRKPCVDKWDNVHETAKKIIMGLMECLRQTGGAAQEGDPSLLASAVSAIISNVGPALSKCFSRHILQIHVTCLCLLKEAFGERHSRAFEIALATEASSALAGIFSPVKASRTHFQLSPESHDSNASISNEALSNKRPTKIAASAAVSALVIEAVVHGFTSLERMVTVLRLKEGLDVIHFMRSAKCSSNGNARSVGAFRVDMEVFVHWFRLLIGNCRNVCDGLIAEILGEPSIVALTRMQRILPISLAFPPAYSIFAFLIWKPLVVNNTSIAVSEDIHHLYQSITSAIGDVIKHRPFRDVCMRDTNSFYELVASDVTDSEFAAMIGHNGLDMHLKALAVIPLRARLFLNSIIDCKLPKSVLLQDESKVQHVENEWKLQGKLVNVLDTLQPAKFHWQWVELRLLLNEQALIEKLETHDVSLVDALRSLSPNSEKASAFENENNFIEIILTRLLVRPDAASLFSEVVHRLGRSLEDSMLLQAKWFLGGLDVLLGRKSIRQRLIIIAESKGFSTKPQFCKPWGWCNSDFDVPSNKGGGWKKFEAASLEEGEVIEDSIESKKNGRGSNHCSGSEGVGSLTEKALVELILPCIDQSSDGSRYTFASDLIKQMNNIEQQISGVTHGAGKQVGTVSSGIEGSTSKGNNRRAIRSGSPSSARWSMAAPDYVPLTPVALRASMSLRLQLLLRLLPIICTEGEPPGRNMRHTLASVIIRLLGSRVVHEDVGPAMHGLFHEDGEPAMHESALSASAIDLSGESLFDRLLLVLHALLSGFQPSWLKFRPSSRLANDSTKSRAEFDRDLAARLQNELDRMQLPDVIRWHIQTAMPVLPPASRCSVSCRPPSVSMAALASLQPGISVSGFQTGNPNPLHRATFLSGRGPGHSKPFPLAPDHEMEVDPWMLLEDGAGSGPSSSNGVIGSSEHGNQRASSWLKGAIRARRTDLTYIGAVDDDG